MVDLLTLLADIPLDLCGEMLLKAEYERANDECTASIIATSESESKTLAARHFVRGYARFNLGQIENALEDLNAAAELSMENKRAVHRFRGVLLTMLECHDAAYDDFKATGDAPGEIVTFLLSLVVHFEHRNDPENVRHR